MCNAARHDVKTHLSGLFFPGSPHFHKQKTKQQRQQPQQQQKTVTIKLSLQSLETDNCTRTEEKQECNTTHTNNKAYKLGINHKSSNCVGIKRLISCRDFIYILRHIRLNADKSFVVI